MVDTVAVKLDKSRQALLDLSARNRLLSLPKQASGKLLNIYNELTIEVYRLLVTDSKNMTFLPGKVSGEESSGGADEESGVSLPQPDDGVDDRGVASRHRDLKLQTKLASDKLQGRLLEMYYDARTFVEEQGVNILYLVLGKLKWFDKNTPDKERFAPLILLPVILERKSAAERFHLSWLQEDATENLSLAAKLKADFGILLPEFKAGDDFDPIAYLDQIATIVSSQPQWEVLPNAMVLGFFSFAKFLMYRDLDPANWPEGKRIDQQGLIVATIQGGFPANDALFPDDVNVDKLIPVAEQRHVVDADSSQSLAIEAVRRGENLVIQGPPGTGKSQTITNVVAAAIADGKKVLFVSEKMAALEVVYRRLSAVGLGPACLELHSNRTNKRRVLDELKATRDLGRPRVEQRDAIVNELSTLRDELNEHCALMHTNIDPAALTPYQVIGHLVRLQDISLNGLPPLLDKPETWTSKDYRDRLLLVQTLRQKFAKVSRATEHPWRGVCHVALLKLDTDRLHEQIPSLQQKLAALLSDRDKLANAQDQIPSETPHSLGVDIALGKQLGSAPTIDRSTVANAIWATGLRNLQQLVDTGTSLQSARKIVQQRFVDSVWAVDLETCRRHIAAHGDSLFRIFVGNYRNAITTVKSHLRTPLPKSLQERLALLDATIGAQKQHKQLIDWHRDGEAAFGSLWRGEQSDWQQLQAAVRWMSGRDGQGLSESFRTLYARLPSPDRCAELGQAASRALESFQQAFSDIIAAYRLDLKEAFGVDSLDHLLFTQIDNRLTQWHARPEAIFDWMQYLDARQKAQAAGLGELVVQLELGRVRTDDLERLFERDYYERLLRRISDMAPQFASFEGEHHNVKIARFQNMDRRRIELAKAEAALMHYERIPRINGGIGPMGILNGEIARKRGHMPIRKLFKMAGGAIQAIKPVFMMSPLSVAQFLEPGAIEFDMLVIDEASQIEPVDALGAVARCKQLVVVGDDRQLPPTRFFSRMTNDSEVDEDDDESFVAGANDVESILSLCIAKGMPQLMLRWHYRSRHQSLIAVSNQQFYKNELYIVPSPYTIAAGMGLRFNYVANGTFDSGGTRVNREEAKIIARAIIQHAHAAPRQSLGVAAFSLQQKVAIQDELELLRRLHPETEPFFNDHPNEPFFIKNLENVQGDERDVIFISVAYARTPSGYLPMQFGPVSRDGGERRLNVLISRAKLRCEVFSSIKADDIDLERGKGKGVAALKVFLGYAETGRLSVASRTDHEMDSPFEIEVKQALEERGFTVHPQVGIAGFFIDVAILDPQQTGRYLLGIECDGITYHSSRSARDRDRLRQTVLEEHGWILHRIWSCDWFRQSAVELDKIVAAIEAAKAELAARDEHGMQSTHPGAMQINFVDREQHAARGLGAGAQGAKPYEEANFAVPLNQELHGLPATLLAELVKQVVDIEGPIHFDEVVTRIRTLWGLQRAGNRIREALDRAHRVLLADKSVIINESYLDLPERAIRVRDRSSIRSSSLRKPEYLPPAEVREAIQTVLRENLGGHRDELPSAVGKMLGFSVISSQLRELVEIHLDSLHAAKIVEYNGMIYRLNP